MLRRRAAAVPSQGVAAGSREEAVGWGRVVQASDARGRENLRCIQRCGSWQHGTRSYVARSMTRSTRLAFLLRTGHHKYVLSRGCEPKRVLCRQSRPSMELLQRAPILTREELLRRVASPGASADARSESKQCRDCPPSDSRSRESSCHQLRLSDLPARTRVQFRSFLDLAREPCIIFMRTKTRVGTNRGRLEANGAEITKCTEQRAPSTV